MRRRRSFRRIALAALVPAALLTLHARGNGEPQPQPDPAEVQRFLAEMEARQSAEAHPRASGGAGKVTALVEGAATRAPSAAMMSKLEDVVSARLAG